jgi:hypothetical protein
MCLATSAHRNSITPLQLLRLLMHNTATRISLPRLLRLSRPISQLILFTLHRLPQCRLPLHLLMLRIDVTIRAL